jgi:hypothetical protein
LRNRKHARYNGYTRSNRGLLLLFHSTTSKVGSPAGLGVFEVYKPSLVFLYRRGGPSYRVGVYLMPGNKFG